MDAHLLDFLNMLLRWAHLVVGIGWIGASFYFVWLDFSLRKRAAMNPGVYGTSWMVHGGGFYHVEKYTVAPTALPPDLHWFKWEAYLTWVTGFALLVVQYYVNASSFLIDKAVMDLTPWQAITISVVSLVAGWLVYDGLCRSKLGENTPLLAVLVFAYILATSYAYTQVFSGRGAFIHVGALVGTMMAANVFAVIIPNQKIMVGQLMRGETPDGKYGRIGKQRSLHNSYLTLPVLLMMVSNHYPFLHSHPHSWLIVALILVSGAMVRHFMIRSEAGDSWQRYSWAAPVAAMALLITVFATAPRGREALAALTVSHAEGMAIVGKHCASCHAAKPTHESFSEAPKGVILTDVDAVRRHADTVMAQAVNSNAMPLGNDTAMTREERDRLGAFLQQLARQ
jgi:uncharacterized membrane protein